MALSPARSLAKMTGDAAHSEVVKLFRKICREVPRICALYELPFTPSEVRHLVNVHFKENAGVTDPRVVQMLVAKGEMELDETVKQWKQRPHIMAFLAPEVADPRQGVDLHLEPVDREDFVEQFLDGSLER